MASYLIRAKTTVSAFLNKEVSTALDPTAGGIDIHISPSKSDKSLSRVVLTTFLYIFLVVSFG